MAAGAELVGTDVTWRTGARCDQLQLGDPLPRSWVSVAEGLEAASSW